MTEPLWQPSQERIAAARLTAFIAQVNADEGLDLAGYDDLYRWSVTEVEAFWTAVWRFCGVIAEAGSGPVLVDGDKMPGAAFFPAGEDQLRGKPAAAASQRFG